MCSISAIESSIENKALEPTLMEKNENVENQLTQKFFWGSHGGIGGSESTEQDAGAITLRFTIEEIKRRGLGLAFDESTVPDYPDITREIITVLESGLMSVMSRFDSYIRTVSSPDLVHETAVKRFQVNREWRPQALKNIAERLMSLEPPFSNYYRV